MNLRHLLVSLCTALFMSVIRAQPSGEAPGVPLFTIPDTVCVNQPVDINPGPIAGSGVKWTYCSSNAGDPPVAVSLGNPGGTMNDPRYITMVRSGLECFSFMTNVADSSIIRTYFGHSFSNPPVSSVSLGSINQLTSRLRGIQILYENGTWFGFLVDGSTLFRFSFAGNTLFGQPEITNDIPFPNVGASAGLIIRKEGTGWVGFANDSQNDNLVRLHFPTQLADPPQVENLGNTGILDGPTGLSMIRWNGECYLFISNEANSTITRVGFGSSFLGAPAGLNLGNLNGMLDHNTGIEVTGDCSAINGFVTNRATSPNGLIRLQFPSGPAGMPVALSLGNPGGLLEPSGLSELVRVGDTLYALIPNAGNNTLTRLVFPPCSAASRSGDTVSNPPPFHYLEPGTWNIHLSFLDYSQILRQECKPIVVIPEPTVSLGDDRTICTGSQTLLDPGPGFSSYLWSTGETTQTITVNQPGSYWVRGINAWACEASDTVNITVMNTVEVTVDTLLCYDVPYFAGGTWQTQAGSYHDTLQTTAGCDSIVHTELTYKPEIPVDVGRDTIICPDEVILLHAFVPGGAYQWQDGSTDSLFLVTQPGIYWVEVTRDGCTASDSILVGHCPAKLWFPTAFTPNGDGLNDTFRPVGISICKFRMIIFDRWGQQLFKTGSMDQGWDGTRNENPCQAGTYFFVAFYETVESPGITEKAKGVFTLMR